MYNAGLVVKYERDNSMYFEYGDKELNHLRSRDKKLAAIIDQMGIIKRKVNSDLFSALIESIVGQQISGKAAFTVCNRLNDLSDFNACKLNKLPIEEIQSCGMSMRKAKYIKGIADAVVNNILDLDVLKDKPDDEVIKTLIKFEGIGTWTAEMLLIFSLMRPDVISYNDLAIRRGIMSLYGHKDLPKERFMRYAKRYKPYSSVASLYLWELSH